MSVLRFVLRVFIYVASLGRSGRLSLVGVRMNIAVTSLGIILTLGLFSHPPKPVTVFKDSAPRIQSLPTVEPLAKIEPSHPALAQQLGGASVSGVWAQLAQCESGGDPTKNTGNGYYGMYQFSSGTWNSMGTGYARADLAPASVQTAAAQKLQARSGWGQWPACARKLGLL